MTSHTSLKSQDWSAPHEQWHRVLDDMLNYLSILQGRPVWKPIPSQGRDVFHGEIPCQSTDLNKENEHSQNQILPFAVGNSHPRLWVEYMVRARSWAVNRNACRQAECQWLAVTKYRLKWNVNWCNDFVSYLAFTIRPMGYVLQIGTSIANYISTLIARIAFMGVEVRQWSVVSGKSMAGYAAELYSYKSPQMRRIFSAFRDPMLEARRSDWGNSTQKKDSIDG